MKKLISACLLGIVLSGCAFGERQANLNYPPHEESGLVSLAQASATSGSRGVIYLENFGDLRSDKKIVGQVRNAFGMKTGEVIAVGDVSEWVRDALAHELRAAGYRVEERAAGPTDATTLSGDIIRVYCDAYFSYDGEVTLWVEAKKAGQNLLERGYSGTGSAGLNLAATGDSYSESLSLALRAALQQVLSDIASLDI